MHTILVGLNELNFQFIEHYISLGQLPHFEALFHQYGYSSTTSETPHHLLEPWIQWVTIYTGKTFAEHQVFRLGDIVNHPDLLLLFEQLEMKGHSIGLISPFNAENRLRNPAFFMPDPWTQTPASGSSLLKKLSQAIAQAVNDNAHNRLTVDSLWALIQGFLYYTPIAQYPWYFAQLQRAKQPGVKAMILDKLLSDLFIKEWKKHKPNFAFLFLNAGAHLQHHYLFNSKAYLGDLKNPEWYCSASIDPILNIYRLYDRIMGLLLRLPGVRLILATGLSQKPHTELMFYWRLKQHTDFLSRIGIRNFIKVAPRMSRDFLIEFSEPQSASQAMETLTACQIQGISVFSVDNRKNSLFVELVYPNLVTDDMEMNIGSLTTLPNFRSHISLVALKNGEHDSIGYYLDTHSVNSTVSGNFPLTQVYHLIMDSLKA